MLSIAFGILALIAGINDAMWLAICFLLIAFLAAITHALTKAIIDAI